LSSRADTRAALHGRERVAEVVIRSSRASDVEVAPLEDGSILFALSSKKFFMLNRSATLLWDQLEAEVSADELAAKLCAHFPDLSMEAARRDVEDALAQLGEAGLITRS